MGMASEPPIVTPMNMAHLVCYTMVVVFIFSSYDYKNHLSVKLKLELIKS